LRWCLPWLSCASIGFALCCDGWCFPGKSAMRRRSATIRNLPRASMPNCFGYSKSAAWPGPSHKRRSNSPHLPACGLNLPARFVNSRSCTQRPALAPSPAIPSACATCWSEFARFRASARFLSGSSRPVLPRTALGPSNARPLPARRKHFCHSDPAKWERRVLSPLNDRVAASHRRCAKDVAAPVGQRASAVRKVALPDQSRAEIFDFAKAEGHELAVQRVRFKITLEGFSHGGDARSKRFLSRGVPVPVEGRSWGIAIIEHNVRAPRQACDELERRENGLLRQIRHDPQPGKERLLRRIEAGGSQAVPQSLLLEIDGGESESVRQRDRRLSKPLALPRLRRRVIHLEDVQVFPERVAIGIRVEARPEHHQLVDGAMRSRSQRGAAWLFWLHRKSLGVRLIAVNWAKAAAACHIPVSTF